MMAPCSAPGCEKPGSVLINEAHDTGGGCYEHRRAWYCAEHRPQGRGSLWEPEVYCHQESAAGLTGGGA